MSKLRLNKEMRERLADFARDNVRATTFDEQAERAYSKALPLVIAAVRKKYPEDDMAVLAKYDMAKPDACLIGYGDNGQQLRFSCRQSDAPVVPKGYCSSRNYAWPAKCIAAIEDYVLKDAQASEERERILRDYTALINNYQTVEDVLEIWPASIAVLQGFINAAGRNLPATLPAEAVERIKNLNIGFRQLAAA